MQTQCSIFEDTDRWK